MTWGDGDGRGVRLILFFDDVSAECLKDSSRILKTLDFFFHGFSNFSDLRSQQLGEVVAYRA